MGEAKRNCGPEPILTTYFSDLDEAGGLNLSDLKAGFENSYVGLKFIVRDGVLTHEVKKGRWEREIRARVKDYRNVIEKVIAEAGLPDMEFVMSILDGSEGPHGVFKVEGFPNKDLLFIPRSLVSDMGARLRFMREKFKRLKCKAGQNKPVAVFRGSTSGTLTFWRDLERENRTGEPPKIGTDP